MVCHWPEARSLVVSSTLNKMDAIWQYAGIWAWSIGPNIIKIDLYSVSLWRTYPTAWPISLIFVFILWSSHFTTQISKKYRTTTIYRGFWSVDKYSSSLFSFSNWNDNILSWRLPKSRSNLFHWVSLAIIIICSSCSLITKEIAPTGDLCSIVCYY